MFGRARDRLAAMSWAHRPPAQAVRNGILCYVLGPIVRHYTHPTVVGAENLDGLSHPVLFAANHSSHIDTPLLLRALPPHWRRRTAVVAAADYFFRNPLVAWLVSLAFGAVPVERSNRPSRDSAARLQEVLSAGYSLLVYPEGTRSRTGRMGPLRSGTARLALDSGVPIVPVCLSGTHRAMPPGRWWPRRHPTQVQFGAPIEVQSGDDHRVVTARLESALVTMADRLEDGAA
jgi:1-acyl-sn-glycerol-3-phosphate acyltransferase